MKAKTGKVQAAFQGGKTIKPGGFYWMRYVIPAMIFYVVFMAYPMLDSVRLSLYEGTAGVRTYVGLDNYVRLFTDEVVSKRFWNAFGNNWIFFAYHMILQNALGITFAAILTNRTMRGRKVYQTIISMLDHRNWHYQRDDEKKRIRFKVTGEDLPMSFLIAVDEPRQIARLMCFFPFDMSAEKRIEGAIATCAATHRLANGCFDYDLNDGQIVFRMNAQFLNSDLGEELFAYMVDISCKTVDDYNDQFLAISKGHVRIEDFLARQ